LFFGFNRWRQQRLANQILKGMYGVNTGLFGGATGLGGLTSGDLAKEMAKEEAKQQADEAKEAAKTPADKYNETEEMPTYDANSTAVANAAKTIIEKVFGKARLVSISTGMYGLGSTGSGVMDFKISRLTTGEDLGTANKVLADMGLPVVQSGIDNKTATVMAGTDNNVYSISFEIGEQNVGISIIKYANE
jgi:hypothetical protein